ncbi:fusion protein [Agrobacterium burrii]|uniref:fusion protein n=1 Tax=Agrobacterium burrii TaxID=2815339 RepID=UPI001FEDADA9|nr:fusion protein [Agrobacterium burrii]
MANTTWYGDGTATVAVGSRTVTGTDTGWLTAVAGLTPIKAGDKFGIHVGRPIVIEQIISDTELLLADDWPGPAQTDAPYKVELTSPTIAAVEAMRQLLASLSNGNLDSLSEISVGTDDIPIGIGPGVFGTIKKFELKDGVQFDEWVPNLAGRAVYNGAAKDFSVLVIDIGDGRSAIYFKNSATSGDWSAPSYVTGPIGPAGVNQRGNYSAGTAYAIRDIVQYGGSTWIAKVATTGNAPPTLPTTENTQWLLFARSGTPGVVDRGAYSGATAYTANDIVLNNGSTWIALQSTTGNAPPVLPTESDAYWRLLARKGTDGTGTGDVVGPAGGVANNDLAVFADATGKLIKKAPNNVVSNALLSQLAAPAIKGRLTAGTGNVEDLTPAQANQLLGGWEPIGGLNLATQSAAIVNNLSAFRAIRCHADFSVDSGAYAAIQASTDNGATFITTSATYPFILVDGSGTGTVTGGNGTVPGLLLGNGVAGSVVSIFSFNKARIARSVGCQNYQTTGEVLRQIGQKIDSSVARNAIRVIASSGVFSYGEFLFEGIRG